MYEDSLLLQHLIKAMMLTLSEIFWNNHKAQQVEQCSRH